MTAGHSHTAGQAPTRKLHPGLLALLLVSLLTSGWALWWPRDEVYPAPHGEPSLAAHAGNASATASGVALVSSSPLLVERAKQRNSPTVLSEATRDPFRVDQPKTLAPSQAVPEPERLERTLALPPPIAAPPMEHRVMGAFTTPEGELLVVLQDGPHAVLAAGGVTLSSGYVIEGVTSHEIRLRHPLADQPVSLWIPVGNAP